MFFCIPRKFNKKSSKFLDLAQIEADFSEILHTTAVFNAEQYGNHADQKSLRYTSKKHNSSPKITKFLNFGAQKAKIGEYRDFCALQQYTTVKYIRTINFRSFCKEKQKNSGRENRRRAPQTPRKLPPKHKKSR